MLTVKKKTVQNFVRLMNINLKLLSNENVVGLEDMGRHFQDFATKSGRFS